MPYGYLGQNTPNQTVSNSGVFSISDVASLEKQGKFGGSLELIEEKTITTSSSVIFTNIKENEYDVHFLTIAGYKCTVDNSTLAVRFYESGIEATSGYRYSVFAIDTSTANGVGKTTSAGNLFIIGGTGNATNELGNAYGYFYNLGNVNKYSFLSKQSNDFLNTAGYFRIRFGGGVLANASVVNQIKLYVGSGTFNATAKLYGVKQI